MPIMGHVRRIGGELRHQLTFAERLAAYSYLLLTVILPPLAAVLLLDQAMRPVGIGLLFGALGLFTVPISPILRARVRRRERRGARKPSGH